MRHSDHPHSAVMHHPFREQNKSPRKYLRLVTTPKARDFERFLGTDPVSAVSGA